MRQTTVEALPDYGPVPQSALGPALNEQGYYVGRVERNLYWVTDGTYLSAFLTTSDGVVLLDAPPTIGHNLQRAVDEIAAGNGVSNKVTYLIYSHHHADHVSLAGGRPITWVSLACELQRDWARAETVEGVIQIVLTERLLKE